MEQQYEQKQLTTAQANKLRELDAAMVHFVSYLQTEHNANQNDGWRLDMANGRFVRAVVQSEDDRQE